MPWGSTNFRKDATVKHCKLLRAMCALMTVLLGGCDAQGPAKRLLDAQRGKIETSYPGPMYPSLTEEQLTKLRECANYQREGQTGL